MKYFFLSILARNFRTTVRNSRPISSRILLAPSHQGDANYFSSKNQCGSMVLANIIRAKIVPPNIWDKKMIHQNMIEGDKLHKIIIAKNLEVNETSIGLDCFIESKHFNVIQNNINMYNQTFEINYQEDGLYGLLDDDTNLKNAYGMNLSEAIENIFQSHNAGLFIAGRMCLGIIKHNDGYFFTDSHPCNFDGSSTIDDGTGCIIECSTIEDIVMWCKERIICRGELLDKTQYTLNYIDVFIKQNETVEGQIEKLVQSSSNEDENQVRNIDLNKRVIKLLRCKKYHYYYFVTCYKISNPPPSPPPKKKAIILQ